MRARELRVQRGDLGGEPALSCVLRRVQHRELFPFDILRQAKRPVGRLGGRVAGFLGGGLVFLAKWLNAKGVRLIVEVRQSQPREPERIVGRLGTHARLGAMLRAMRGEEDWGRGLDELDFGVPIFETSHLEVTR